MCYHDSVDIGLNENYLGRTSLISNLILVAFARQWSLTMDTYMSDPNNYSHSYNSIPWFHKLKEYVFNLPVIIFLVTDQQLEYLSCLIADENITSFVERNIAWE